MCSRYGNRRLNNQILPNRKRNRVQPFANSSAKGGSPQYEYRNVGAERKADLREAVPRHPQAPESVQTDQHRRCIGAAATQASANRNHFPKADRDPWHVPGRGCQSAGSPYDQICLRFRGNGVFIGRRTQKFDLTIVAPEQIDPVAQVNELERCFDRVVSVRAPAGDVKKQIQFRRSWQVSQFTDH